MEEDRSRPQTGSSDHENVGARVENAREEGLDTDANSFAQDNFEDAASMARSLSGERSLTGRRSSTDSKTTLDKRDSDVPDVPPVPAVPAAHIEANGQDSASDDNKVDDKTSDKEDYASTTKSPPLKANSVLSSESMDEVNLDEGKQQPLLQSCCRAAAAVLATSEWASDLLQEWQQNPLWAVARAFGRIDPRHEMSH